jgi:hypothetical protein
MIRKGGRGNKIGHAKDQLMNVVELDLQFWMHGAVRSGKAGSTPAITPRRLPPLSLVHHTLHLSNTLAHRLCKNSIASGLCRAVSDHLGGVFGRNMACHYVALQDTDACPAMEPHATPAGPFVGWRQPEPVRIIA